MDIERLEYTEQTQDSEIDYFSHNNKYLYKLRFVSLHNLYMNV